MLQNFTEIKTVDETNTENKPDYQLIVGSRDWGKMHVCSLCQLDVRFYLGALELVRLELREPTHAMHAQPTQCVACL